MTRYDEATELWRMMVRDVLHDVPMTGREEHLAAACFWLGMSTGRLVSPATLDVCRSAAAASLSCILPDKVKETAP